MEGIERRKKKFEQKKIAKEMNKFGQRLAWIKAKLDLTTAQIMRDTGISKSTLCDWEAGVQSDYWQEVQKLAFYLNQKWKAKFKEHFPTWENRPIESVTFVFLTVEKELSEEDYKRLAVEFKERLKKQEYESAMRELELKRQLDLLRPVDIQIQELKDAESKMGEV